MTVNTNFIVIILTKQFKMEVEKVKNEVYKTLVQ